MSEFSTPSLSFFSALKETCAALHDKYEDWLGNKFGLSGKQMHDLDKTVGKWALTVGSLAVVATAGVKVVLPDLVQAAGAFCAIGTIAVTGAALAEKVGEAKIDAMEVNAKENLAAMSDPRQRARLAAKPSSLFNKKVTC